jgi:hypothetical protein
MTSEEDGVSLLTTRFKRWQTEHAVPNFRKGFSRFLLDLLWETISQISVIRVHKISLYEKQGILEDIDSDCGDSADGTDHHTRSLLVYVSGHSPRSWYHSIS